MTNLKWIARRTLAVARREGPLGAIQRIVKYLRLMLGIPSAEIREYRRFKAEADRAFDEQWGVDTGGTQLLADLTINSPNAVLGGSHIATGPRQFHRAMSGLDIDPATCTFVDLGSGKGRALMMAAGYPFAAITGVEFAEELDAIARRNLARLGDPRVTCHLGDAETFDYPLTDLVVFMNNPFDPPLVERIARRLEATARAHPRTIRVVYINPCAPEVFAGTHWFRVAEVSGGDVFGLRASL
jgi:SAM-dependent methyltransferase